MPCHQKAHFKMPCDQNINFSKCHIHMLLNSQTVALPKYHIIKMPWQFSNCINVGSTKCCTNKTSNYKMPCDQNISISKCHIHVPLNSQIIASPKCHIIKMPWQWGVADMLSQSNVVPKKHQITKCHVIKTSAFQNATFKYH